MAILPYYVANLNIEATYAGLAGEYAEFPGLCFVDTLDNVAALGVFSGHQHDMFGAISDENIERVKRQNQRKISVIIGNPPYNAWQENYNQNNANRPYRRVDERIKNTYVKEGTAQNQNSVYDMYTRFFRWASDRLKDDGVLAFITGRKPFSKASYDGFRKVIEREFAEIWVVDLGGDVRDNPKLSGTKHNVFSIQTGVSICFLVKKKGKSGAVIRYARRPENEGREDKLAFLAATKSLTGVEFRTVQPNKKFEWLEQDNTYDDGRISLLPTKAKIESQSRGIFLNYSMGAQPKLDEWIYDKSFENLSARMKFYLNEYNIVARTGGAPNEIIKWHRELARKAKQRRLFTFGNDKLRRAQWRPFTIEWFYNEPSIISMNFLQQDFFRGNNSAIVMSGPGSGKPFASIATSQIPNHDLLEKSQSAPRFRYTKGGVALDNITDWALEQFTARYGKGVTKDDIFAYVYAVLHDPVYRETYALNLKREFPRIPLYADFKRWRDWGQTLLGLHIGYETAEPFGLVRTDTPDPKRAEGTSPVVKLKSDHATGIIVLDSETQLGGVPPEAWRYVLGNRTAIDWVLDQHKEKTPKDPTIREKFNTYRFADYKEAVVDLLQRVTTVSVETVWITDAMKALPEAARAS